MASATDLVIALLDVAGSKEIAGRTLLQKQAYFANEKAQLGLNFSAHFYGPFSRQISNAVDTLVASGLVDERIEEFPQFSSSVWERKRYTYHLTTKGEQLTKRVMLRLGKAASSIRETIEGIERAGLTKEYMTLAAASKVYYIVKRSGRPLSSSRIPAEAKRVGWTLSEAEVKRVTRFLESLGMIRTVKAQT